MSYKKFEIIQQSSPFFITETTIFPPKSLSINPFFPPLPIPFEEDEELVFPTPFDSISDLIQIESTPFCSSFKRVIRRVDSSESYLKKISDRVSSLESKFDRLLLLKEKEEKEKKKKQKELKQLDRKYSFTAEIKGDVEKKYKWTAEIEGDDVKKGKRGERKYQWMTEIKGKEDDKRVYTWKATIGGDKKKKEIEKKKKKNGGEKGSSATRIVEIEESPDQRAVVLRQAFAKRAANGKGKKKELSPVDAAALIQYSFRAYLIRRSQALRALRELAIAKTKLKELRAMFHNFSYRSRVSRDAEERQKFSEKIIVLLLTVDAIEGVDVMVRAAKRSMVDELEAMLDVVEPQSDGESLSMRRRTFDMPSGTIQKEIAEGVAQVVQMLDEENGTFEACV